MTHPLTPPTTHTGLMTDISCPTSIALSHTRVDSMGEISEMMKVTMIPQTGRMLHLTSNRDKLLPGCHPDINPLLCFRQFIKNVFKVLNTRPILEEDRANQLGLSKHLVTSCNELGRADMLLAVDYLLASPPTRPLPRMHASGNGNVKNGKVN